MLTSIKPFKFAADLLITLLLWIYFLIGYLPMLFSSLISALSSDNEETKFQKQNHIFFKRFFAWVRLLIPRVKFIIPEDVLAIRSSIIICNHLSYLDPILLVSMFEKHKTVVKGTFFKVPIMSWILIRSGYIPSNADDSLNTLLIKRIEGMTDYLQEGGNFFIFPEGTRSRDGKLSRFIKGGFNIAKRSKAPIELILIKNTNKLFVPGKFLFNTREHNTIEFQRIGRIEPDYDSESFSTKDLIKEVRTVFQRMLDENSNDTPL